MKTFVLAVTAALTWLTATTGFAQWPHTTYDSRSWEWEAGTRIMERLGTDQNLNLISDALTNQVLFTSEDATDLESSAGVDLRFLNRNCYGIEWEVRTFYNDWDIFSNVASANNIQSPFFTPIANAIPAALGNVTFQQLNYDYQSQLFNIELNAKKAVLPGVTLLIGPRFLYLEEQLNIDINGTIAGPPAVALTANNSIVTENPLIGLQVGVDVNVPVSRDIFISAYCKAGGYGNTARATVNQSNNIQGTTSISSFRRSQGSFVGEVGGKVNMDVIPGLMSFYAGYEAMWLDNVAIAPVQLLGGVNGAINQVQMTGTPFVHGVVVGATIRR